MARTTRHIGFESKKDFKRFHVKYRCLAKLNSGRSVEIISEHQVQVLTIENREYIFNLS
jgi:uncharacterized protein (DUF2249 family)